MSDLNSNVIQQIANHENYNSYNKKEHNYLNYLISQISNSSNILMQSAIESSCDNYLETRYKLKKKFLLIENNSKVDKKSFNLKNVLSEKENMIKKQEINITRYQKLDKTIQENNFNNEDVYRYISNHPFLNFHPKGKEVKQNLLGIKTKMIKSLMKDNTNYSPNSINTLVIGTNDYHSSYEDDIYNDDYSGDGNMTDSEYEDIL